MVEMSAAAAFSIGRRAESDIRHGLSEAEVKAEIKRACISHDLSRRNLNKVTNEIYDAAKTYVEKTFNTKPGPET
ncbi:MAG: hypothetical protein NVS3B29_03320 [Candidatus Saccharimonadales bacterium]